jgi:hypothetical protein
MTSTNFMSILKGDSNDRFMFSDIRPQDVVDMCDLYKERTKDNLLDEYGLENKPDSLEYKLEKTNKFIHIY